MKIARLHLKAFGCFTDRSIDLVGNKVNLIYGPNEAGKSVALRALESFLFGIESRSSDDFIHPKKDLRVGACLVTDSGREIWFYRRKGTKNTLLTEDGKPVPEEALGDMLGGIEPGLFQLLFGLDHERLTEGGREILCHGGLLDHSLFAAGTGMTQIRERLGMLESRANELFRPTASSTIINRLARDYTAAQKEIKEGTLSAAKWQKANRELEAIRTQSAQTRSEVQELDRQINQLTRYRDAINWYIDLQVERNKLERLKDSPLLSNDFSRRHEQISERLEQVRKDLFSYQTKREELLARRSGLKVSEGLLHEEANITRIHSEVGKYRKNCEDLLKREKELAGEEQKAASLLAQLDSSLELDNASGLRLHAAVRQEIQDLCGRLERLDTESRSTSKDLQRKTVELERTRRNLADAPSPANPVGLTDALRLAQSILSQQSETDDRLAHAEDLRLRAESEFARLRPRSGSIEQLATSSAPEAETIDRFRQLMEQASRKVEQGQLACQEHKEELAGIESELKTLMLSEAVPSVEELSVAREERDEQWKLIRHALEHGGLDAGKGVELADRFETLALKADDIADRLRREAERVNRRAVLTVRKETLGRKLETISSEVEREKQGQAALTMEWKELWSASLIEPLPPAEMSAWLVRRNQLCSLVDELDRTLRDVERREARRKEVQARLEIELAATGNYDRVSGANLSELCQIAEERCVAITDAISHRKQLEDRANSLSEEIDQLEAEQAARHQQHEQERDRWHQRVKALGMQRDSTPAAALRILDVHDELFIILDKAQITRGRINGMKTEIVRFETDARELINRLDAQASLDNPASGIEVLNRSFIQSRAEAEALLEIERQLLDEVQCIKAAEEEISALEGRLREMVLEAGAESVDELEEIEKRSDDKSAAMKRTSELEDELRRSALLGKMTLDVMLSELEQQDPDRLGGEIEELQRLKDTKEKAREELVREEERREGELRQLSDASPAVEAQERAESKLAEMRDQTDIYLRTRLAAMLLARKMEAFRKENQDPLLARTGEHFRRLTLDRYEGLRVAFDRDTPIIVGYTPAQSELGVAAMSDGTADQLFLALRLAAIEQYVSKGVSLPLFFDDILIQFDDDRARAALSILSELASMTQVLFFTHHRHLLDLAKGLKVNTISL